VPRSPSCQQREFPAALGMEQRRADPLTLSPAPRSHARPRMTQHVALLLLASLAVSTGIINEIHTFPIYAWLSCKEIVASSRFPFSNTSN